MRSDGKDEDMILANKILQSAFFQNLKTLVTDSKEALLAFEGVFVILLIILMTMQRNQRLRNILKELKSSL